MSYTLRDYTINVAGETAVITATDKTKTTYLAIPSTSEVQSLVGMTISEISLSQCFSGCTNLTTAPTIPSKTVDMSRCFYNCTSLTAAPTIPSGVIYMGDCFRGCTSLTAAPTIPSGVIYMDDCFRGCTSLTAAPTIPSSVTDLSGCFYGCTNLTAAPAIPNSVVGLSYCFYNCTSLPSAPTIPNSVTDLTYCFGHCTSLTAAPTIPSSVTDLYGCFYGCTSLASAPTIPSSVANMNCCFRDCVSLASAPTIPSSVTDLRSCFYGCTSLTAAPTIPNNVVYMDYCFRDCTNITTAPAIPSGVADLTHCFYGCINLTTAPTIPGGVTDLHGCFYGCIKLTGKIIIDATPTNYGNCFYNTVKKIGLSGASANRQELANTASNSNVYVYTELDMLPAINRCVAKGVLDDEGTKALITVSGIKHTNGIRLTGFRLTSGNTDYSSLTTWYTTYSSSTGVDESTAIDWTSGYDPSGDEITLYGVVNSTFNTGSTYSLDLKLSDEIDSTAVLTLQISLSFYTIDTQAGGKEISFGELADDDLTNYPKGLFKCAMDMLLRGVRVPTIYLSTSDPTSSEGENGDIWIKYTAPSE